jgi:trimeric autotransporter adhesin
MNQIKLFFLGALFLFTTHILNAQGGASCAAAQVAIVGTNNTSGLGVSPGTGVDNSFKWFSYTATGCGSVTIASCNGGSDTRLAVTTGTCAAPVAVGNNDDSCADGIPGPVTAYASTLTFNVANGTTYYISWGNGWDATNFAWTLAFTPSTLNNIGILGKSTEYSVIPKRQFSGTAPVTVAVSNSAGVSNTGLVVTCNVTTGTGFTTPVTTLTSPSMTVPCGTVSNVAMGNATLPTTAAVYRFIYTYTSNQVGTDNTAADNRDTTFLIISDDFYARADAYTNGNIDGGLGVTGSVASPAEAFQGMRYDFVRADIIDSINFNMAGGSIGDSLFVRVYDIVAGVPTNIVAQSARYIIPSAGPRNLTLALTTPFPVAAGTNYVVGVTHRARGLNAAFSYSLRNFTVGASWIKINAAAFNNPENIGFAVSYLINPIFQSCSPITVTTTPTSALCTSASGSATASATQLATPVTYTYAWSNGATGATATGLAAGTYTVVSTDQFGCTASGTAVVGTNNVSINVTTSSTNTSCGAATGSATATPTSGLAPYTYLWSNSAATQTASNLGAGTYSVVTSDANGCTGTASATVNNPSAPLVTSNITNVLCGGASTGGITTSSTGGTMPLTYIWSNGATTQNLLNIPAGTYSLTVTDAANCGFTLNGLAVTAPAAITLAGFPTLAPVTCNGGTNGSITGVFITGGTPPYTYAWSNGATTQNLLNIPAGNYSGTVTDVNGCRYVSPTVPITEPTAITLGGVPVFTQVRCFGGSTGAITNVVITGGNPPYTYAWSNGATTTNLINIPAGAYSGTVTDVSGCRFVAGPVNITQPAAALAGSTTTTNDSGTGNGAVQLTVTGGTVPYTYAWSNGTTAQNLLNVTGGATYTVVITDGNGCTSTASGNVILAGVEDLPNVNSISVFPNPASSDMTVKYDLLQADFIQVDMMNAIGQVVMTRKNANTLNGQLTFDVSNLPSGMYAIKLTVGENSAVKNVIIAR